MFRFGTEHVCWMRGGKANGAVRDAHRLAFETHGGSTGSSRAFSRPTVIRFVVSRLFAQAGRRWEGEIHFNQSLSPYHKPNEQEQNRCIDQGLETEASFSIVSGQRPA